LKLQPGNHAQIFELRNNRLKNIHAFLQGDELDIYWGTQFPSIPISTDATTYIKLKIDKEAYFPYVISNEQEYYRNAVEESVYVGIFYGFSLMVILLNMFLYYNFRDLSFLLYSIFLFFIIAVFAYRDGFAELIGISQNFKEFTEPIIHAIGGLAGAAFATEFLNLKRHYPLLCYSYYFLVLPFSILVVLYLLTGNYLYFLGIDILCLYIFSSSWFCALLLYRNHKYAAIFRVSYLLMLCAATMFYLFPALNIEWLEIEQRHLKWTGYLEMVVITSAVVYRMKMLREKNKKMLNEVKNYLTEINYLSEELERVQQGEKSVLAKYDLTARESEILDMIAQGESNKQIAEELFISINTVKFHVKKIYEKLEVSNRREASQLLQDVV
jgi:DNA-binding CsgD family transcriptional regulator